MIFAQLIGKALAATVTIIALRYIRMCVSSPAAAIAFYEGRGYNAGKGSLYLPTPLTNIPIDNYLNINDTPKGKRLYRKFVVAAVAVGFACMIHGCFDEIWPQDLIASEHYQISISVVAAFASLILGARCVDWFVKIAYRLMLVPQSPKQQGEDGPALLDKDYFRATDIYKK
jgi:hypothetical protein